MEEYDIAINEEVVNKKKMFVAHCLTLGIASQGKTVEEALKNIKEAIALFENKPLSKIIKEALLPPMAARIFL